jgi:mannose-6-phosphate isomerase
LANIINSQTFVGQALQFSPIYKETIWGGRNLETMLGKTLPPSIKIGESWEISGCGKDQSIVQTAGFATMTLAQLLQSNGPQLLGQNVVPPTEFPLLFKLIDAHDKLSVQVHPSDADAHANGWGPFGKTECWYIVHAEPGATIVAGFKKAVTKDDVAAAVQNTTLTNLLEFHPVSAGDMIFIPAGTVHAICSNILIYEVQQTSDFTFRLYDWGRVDGTGKSRTLHVKESLQVVSTRWQASYKIPSVPVETLKNGVRSMRIACRYFAIEEYNIQGEGNVTLPHRKSFQTIMVLDGTVAIGGTHPVILTKGQSALLPASMPGPKLHTESKACFLISWVPDLQSEVVDPLKSSGLRRKTIASLGGNYDTNDLIKLL